MEKTDICVLGACNMDLISYVKRLPVLGETLHGRAFKMGFGGKGANQAVMAARLGGSVAMISKLGNDVFGKNTLDNFNDMGINASHVYMTDRAFSGVAPISVDEKGNNSIIIVTGANDLLSTAEIDRAEEILTKAKVLVCQLEIPMELNLHALRMAKKAGVTTIFNPAPAVKDLPDELYELSDIFCPNETETQILTGMPVSSIPEAEKAAKALLNKGPKTVLLTLGERGSLIVDRGKTLHLKTETVKALDTTGAGDCFVGSLAYFLAKGKDIQDAVVRSNKIAAISVTGQGTQTSFPYAADLSEDILEKAREEPLKISTKELAKTIDHTLLKPQATKDDILKICDQAILHGFKAVCVNSCHVRLVSEKLSGTDILTCSVIGFPLGQMDSASKAFEAEEAVRNGADELDMVINVGALKSGDYDLVLNDIKAVRRKAPLPVKLKVIIEACLLSSREIVSACQISKKAGADFVKTSTGFSDGGAKAEDIRLMRETVGPDMGVKASGGIKDAKDAIKMILAGANRIGAGAGVEIVSGLKGKGDY